MADEQKDQGVVVQTQPNMNKNDEPPVFLAPGNVDLNPGGFDELLTTVPPQRQVDANLPRRVLAENDERYPTEADMQSELWKKMGPGQQVQFPSLVLRPGDIVRAGVEVMGLNNVKERIMLFPGAEVPGDDIGYFPVNYVPERLLREAIAVDREARDRAQAEADRAGDEVRQEAVAEEEPTGSRTEAATTRSAPRAEAKADAKDKK